MKNFVLVIIVCISSLQHCKSPSKGNTPATIDTTHTSKTSVDWDGIYRGVLPCADCEGIETTIALSKDANYTLRTKYLGKSDSVYETSGKFSWSKQGNSIRLDNGPTNANNFFVGENRLTQLDKDGNKITGALADRYILHKSNNDIVEKYWKLTELRGKPVEVDSTYIKEPHIIFKQQENRIIGHGGCNSISGSYEFGEGNKIIISNVIATRMSCASITVELEFLNVLAMADNYNVNGDMLVLNKAKMAPLARFKVVRLK